MTIELSTLYGLRKGRIREVSVGPLDRIGVIHLRSKTNDVRLAHKTLLHIDEHDGIDDFGIIAIPYGLSDGMFIGEHSAPNHLIITYVYPDNNIRYKAVVKTARGGEELWLCTFCRFPLRTDPGFPLRTDPA